MSENLKDTKELYQKLRQYRGTIGEISKRSGRTREWVRKVLLGMWPDVKVIKIAGQVLKERYKEEEAIITDISNVVSACDISRVRSTATI